MDDAHRRRQIADEVRAIRDRRYQPPRTTVTVRPFRDRDADQLAAVIHRCVREVNRRDYSAEIIEAMCGHFSPDYLRRTAVDHRTYVAASGEEPVGTVTRDGNKVYTMFVDPGQAGRGVGRLLMDHVEGLVSQEGFTYLETGASITAHGFYHRLGYHDVREAHGRFGLIYILQKSLVRASARS